MSYNPVFSIPRLYQVNAVTSPTASSVVVLLAAPTTSAVLNVANAAPIDQLTNNVKIVAQLEKAYSASSTSTYSK